jgi:hypothetical protein
MKSFIIKTAKLLMAVAISLTACKKDTSNNTFNTSIVGTWQLTHYHEMDVDSTTNPISIIIKDTSYTDVIVFGSSNGYAIGYDNTNMSNGIIGSYHLIGSDSISYVFGPGPPPQKARYTIQGTTLTLFDAPRYLYDSLHYYITTQTYIRLK